MSATINESLSKVPNGNLKVHHQPKTEDEADCYAEKEEENQAEERIKLSKVKAPCVQRAGTLVSEGLESLFYKLGFAIAMRPWTVILCTFLMSALCGLGMIRFEIKDSSAPIWIPEDSQVRKNQLWVEDVFPVQYRYNLYIVTADNILRPEVLKEMLQIDKQVKALSQGNNTENKVLNFNWTSLCIKGGCKKIRETTASPVYKFEYSPKEWLGGLSYDDSGQLIGAKAAKMLYVIKATSTDFMNTRIVGPDLVWEKKFIELGLNTSKKLTGSLRSLDVSAVRSFRDESDNSYGGDVVLLMVGVGIIVTYVAIILGKFNEVEHKVYLALIGVFGIGLASLVSYGLASAVGMFYGPIHPILPFLLLGLGVDDMFVIIEAWNNLTALEKKKDLKVKVAIAMKHAGVSITVTSITDFVAFAIGATTTLPALKSFCVYAALGIFSLFIIQSTFFVAWLTIDQRRQDASRDACCIWIKYSHFVPNKCSQKLFLPWFLRKFFGPFLMSLPIKVLIISLVVCMLGISGYGAYRLKTEQDLSWFLQTDSYLTKFSNTQDKYFNEGIMADLYTADIDYYHEKEKLERTINEIKANDLVRQNSTIGWHRSFLDWLKTKTASDTAWYLGVELDEDHYPKTESGFYQMLNVYSVRDGIQFYTSLKWNDTNPRNPRHLTASKISMRLKKFQSTAEEIAALKYFEETTRRYFNDKAFVWTVSFRAWETSSIIQRELYTNVGLAFAAVFIVTLFLVANIWACALVCLCVVITLVNVCGFMHFWGLTIDTLTSILLILSIGLAIDYSAHIGHKFMTIAGTKNERAKHTVSVIGPAVINGGFSTFLAFSLLSTSNSYHFITFFKVFFLVGIFGLFNGICFLPVILSLLGPEPYLNAIKYGVTVKEATELQTLVKNKHKKVSDKKLNSSLDLESSTDMTPGTTVTAGSSRDCSCVIKNENGRQKALATEKIQFNELDTLLDQLQRKSDTQQQWQMKISQPEQTTPDNYETIVKSCEDYIKSS